MASSKMPSHNLNLSFVLEMTTTARPALSDFCAEKPLRPKTI